MSAPGDEAPFPERSYDEILASGKKDRSGPDEGPFSAAALVAVLAIFGALVSVAVLMAFADRNEVGTPPAAEPSATVAPSRSPEPRPEPTPTPAGFGPVANAPEPFVMQGTGTKVFEVRYPDAGLTIVSVTADRGRYLLSEVDEYDIRKFNVAVGTGPEEDVSVVRGDATVHRWRVEATGTWTVELRSARGAPVLRAPFAGTGPATFWYVDGAGIGEVTSEAEHPSHWLRVLTYDGDTSSDSLALLPDKGTERVRWPAGPVLVHVEAEAPWRIAVSPI